MYWLEVFHLIIRYLHVIAGIAWIGASFYFIWLDISLKNPPEWKKKQGVSGDLWAIHGGGFYEVAKYQNGPQTMPQDLHWFKWEAYTTWISGFTLFTLLYYINAPAYLMDAQKTSLALMPLISLSLCSLILSVIAYFCLCKSPLSQYGLPFVLVSIILLTCLAYFLNHFFSDRAVYIHIGVLLGSIMAANVLMVIMPAQRYMVKEISEGRVPAANRGALGKMHSVHNNYMTLPVIFLMISNHFPFTYGHEWGWLILGGLVSIGIWIRHYFNLKHAGNHQPWILASGILFFLILMYITAPPVISKADASSEGVITDHKAWQLVDTHCRTCHSQNPTSSLFVNAPGGFELDEITQMINAKDKIFQRVVISKDMPLANPTNMTDDERHALGAWLNKQ